MSLPLYAQNSITKSEGTAAQTSNQEVNPETKLLISDNGTNAGGSTAGTKRLPLVSTWDFIRMILVLGAVVGVIYLLFFILKKGTRKKFADNELIDIIASKDLTGGKAVHLIKIGESIFLIGAADNSINLISRITEQETLDSLKLEISEKGRGAKKSFQNALSDIFSRKNKGDPVEESMDFLKKQRERLHKLK